MVSHIIFFGFNLHYFRYAKALHYKEQEFHLDKSAQVFEALILINNKLQQKEAAEGLLEYVMANRNAADELKVRKEFLVSFDLKLNVFRSLHRCKCVGTRNFTAGTKLWCYTKRNSKVIKAIWNQSLVTCDVWKRLVIGPS